MVQVQEAVPIGEIIILLKQVHSLISPSAKIVNQ